MCKNINVMILIIYEYLKGTSISGPTTDWLNILYIRQWSLFIALFLKNNFLPKGIPLVISASNNMELPQIKM
jgi:hypothetical protein